MPNYKKKASRRQRKFVLELIEEPREKGDPVTEYVELRVGAYMSVKDEAGTDVVVKMDNTCTAHYLGGTVVQFLNAMAEDSNGALKLTPITDNIETVETGDVIEVDSDEASEELG